MQYLILSDSELTVSTLCFGTANIGGTISQNTSFALLDAYLEHGGNFLDSAKIYADWLPGEKSISEKTIGRWMRQRKNRDQLVVATKGGHPELTSMHIARLSRAELLTDVTASLKNLNVERIDLYWLHRDDVQRSVAEILESLWELADIGKIRYFGCSNWRAERIQAAQRYAERCGRSGFIANQMMWNAAHIEPRRLPDQTMVAMDAKLKEYHCNSGLTAIPYSSQANGWFQRMAQGTVEQMSAPLQALYTTPQNMLRCYRVQELAKKLDLSVTDVILSYLQSQPFPTIPIVGCRRLEQLIESLRAGDVRLKSEDVHYIEREPVSGSI